MTIPKIYGSFIRNLPVSEQNKNWLMRNWKGGLIGAISGFILGSGTRGAIGFITTGSPYQINLQNISDLAFKYPIVGLIFLIIGFIIGAVVQSSLIGRLNK